MNRALSLSTAALFAAAVAACSDSEAVNALVVDAGAGAGGAAASTTTTSSTGGMGGAPAKKRTVLQRDPFGDVAETQNLLWDGDFEWYSAFADEYGWLEMLNPTTFTFDYVITGPDCHSGLKCAKVPSQETIVGIAVASEGKDLEASFWAKPEKGDCSTIEASVTTSIFFVRDKVDADAAVTADSKTPDSEGWCRFDSIVPARTQKPVLFIDNAGTGTAIVDDCVLKVAPPEVRGVRNAPSPHLVDRAERFRHDFQGLRGPHDKPPNAARRAFEARKVLR